MLRSVRIKVTGKVQGVGFRPYIYGLSRKYNIQGTVQNNLDVVFIQAEGESDSIASMIDHIQKSPPQLAKIIEMTVDDSLPSYFNDFKIVPSIRSSHAEPLIPSDAGMCNDCLREMRQESNRRFQYPFTNCTQCGPRYSIIRELPYDRPHTAMDKFHMCIACREEYENPTDRRHHAQPVCCPDCGPDIILYDSNKKPVKRKQKAIHAASTLLSEGKIVSIKGIGGYHLACDAHNEKAINELRIRKNRPQRPLAIMAKSLETALKYCHVTEKEAEMLKSPEMPIVVLRKKKCSDLPELLSPGLSTIGIMLPYSPLHHLLFENSKLECIVLTSSNPSGHPLYFKEDPGTLCDYILTHNRPILHPIDDSVIQVSQAGEVIFLRRSRGFIPEVFKTAHPLDQILALGGNQKNAFAAGKGHSIYMGPHIGDLENQEMLQHYENQVKHYNKWLGFEEKKIAADLHPSYAVTKYASDFKGPVIRVQHHHAHHVSCMADNDLYEPCFGLILDGTGYGDDGHIWGFELLYGCADSFERLGHLTYTPLPGGEKAVKEPWRNAAGMILHFWPGNGKELALKLFPEKAREISIIEHMVNKKIQTPLAGTCGRLFDAVSAILGICQTSTYEGEAAMKLSDYMYRSPSECNKPYPFKIIKDRGEPYRLDFSQMIYQIIQENFEAVPPAVIIQRFHQTIASASAKLILCRADERPELSRRIVFSGGSFQNLFLAGELSRMLEENDFTVYTHKKVPCHDGGLSLGQLMIAARQTKAKKI
ncbi:carbamoyltransferase HypF [Paenibacillus sp. FSL R5-0490]|uniref:carbamoyltransferase HypF n=1 Tax=Paenibacillus sp. FSL R5-0490 TaxID=1920424 RepID=UPI00096C74B2|nr:carbamoyltransferase HypF [Paenibacillus sp. FSL R5-0490]OMF62837.1 carbamoyltransferase HypF [Paenibacillus sp. FSL R5-0490]